MSDTVELRHRRSLEPFADGETIRFSTFRQVSGDRAVQARYEDLRLAGESHNMAELLATRSFPGLRTDSIFNEGRCNGNQFEQCPDRGEYYRRIAEAQGVSTTGKSYLSGLAQYPGDPRAWVSDRGDVLRVARENNLTVSGYVEYAPPEAEPRPPVTIAKDIVEREVADIVTKYPDLTEDEVREKVIEVRTGAVDHQGPLVSDHNFEIDDLPGLEG